jgi:hypothetical protein
MASRAESLLVEGDRVAGRYRIEALIAEGGMGAVYRARDESSGNRVALKRRTERDARVAKMFEREYHTLVSLKHPRIIEAYDYGVDARGAYYTMELLDGSDLRELAPVSFRHACRYLRDVASSLAFLHARRLLHRDISARNVRVTSDDRCKLIDFGVLASFGVTDVLAGTPPFVSPEALGGAPLDQRADLFALGALAYWLLTARHAFPARTLDALPQLWQVSPLPPSRAASLASSPLEPVPPALDLLVLALLSTNPLARPASAAEVIDRLTAIGGLEPDVEPLAAESYLSAGRCVGREREQSRLLSRLRAALEGTGTAIAIDADPGLGSSRLLAELAIEARLCGATPLVVDAQLHRGAYGVIHDLIRKLLEAVPDRALRAAEPDAGVLAHFSRDLAARLPKSRLQQKLAPGELRMRVQTALADWLFAISAERPLLVAIDNAHRMDEGSGAVVASVAYHARDHSIMLAAVFKSGEELSAPLVVKSLSETGARMKLEPLQRGEMEQLVRGLFGDVPQVGRLSEHLYRSSAGNPQQCLEQVRQLVRSAVVRHAGGVWVLPREFAAHEAQPLASPHASRVARLPPGFRRLAEALSVHRGPLPLDRCLAIAEHEEIANVWGALEELTREEVLHRTGSHYHFVHDKLRQYLLAEVEPARRLALHRRIGEEFAASAQGDVDAMLDAGFHLLQGGQEGRGADLLATAGLLLGYDSDEMGAAIPALRAALDVFRKEQRGPHELVKLLGPLCNAAWYCDRRLAAEYGEEAIDLLSDLLGLSLAARLRPRVGKRASLYIGLGSAALRFMRKGYGGIEGLRAMLVMYFNCVLSLGGVAATCLDAERAIALADKLEHLTALGKDHAATLAHRFAVLLSQVPREHLAETIAGYRELLVRILSTRPTRDLPEDSRLMMIGGINYAIGALESFRDDDAALESAKALDDVGLELYAMVADQVRANYHACRGELELADYFRDRVEMHAVQAGSGWQAEVWAPASAILACLITDDVVGMKRTSEELDRLAADIPSLQRHAALARAGYMLLRGDAAQVRALFHAELTNVEPRSFIGWGAIWGAYARACNALGHYAEAKQVCQTILSQLSTDDQQLTAMYLILQLELALSEAYLGQPEAGIQRTEALLDKHRDRGGPLTLGSLHRTRALIAIHVRDDPSAHHHLAEMERCLRPTNNPALLQQCEKLRAQIGIFARDPGSHPESHADATAVDAMPMLEGATHTERMQRALSLIIAQTMAESGYLFEMRDRELVLLASVAGGDAPEHVIDQVRRDIRSFERNRRRAVTALGPAELTLLTMGPLQMRTNVRPREQDYRTVILSVDDERVVGAAAVLVGERYASLRERLVRSLARSMLEGHDTTAAPTLRGAEPTLRE